MTICINADMTAIRKIRYRGVEFKPRWVSTNVMLLSKKHNRSICNLAKSNRCSGEWETSLHAREERDTISGKKLIRYRHTRGARVGEWWWCRLRSSETLYYRRRLIAKKCATQSSSKRTFRDLRSRETWSDVTPELPFSTDAHWFLSQGHTQIKSIRFRIRIYDKIQKIIKWWMFKKCNSLSPKFRDFVMLV